MTAAEKTSKIAARLNARGISLSLDAVNTLRRAEMTLQRWAELECGDGNDRASWAIERDEETGKPVMATYYHDGKTRRTTIADREAGALRRVAKVCAENGLHYFHQTDPRGCALYVSKEALTDSSYSSNGVAICL